MMKKKLAILTAILCTASMSVLPASAENDTVSVNTGSFDNGGTEIINVDGYPVAIVRKVTKIWVETDGTALPKEAAASFANFSNLRYPHNEYPYEIVLNYIGDREGMIADCRRLMMEYDFVVNAYIQDVVYYSDAAMLENNNLFHIESNGSFDSAQIPELSEFTVRVVEGDLYTVSIPDPENSEFLKTMQQKDLATEFDKAAYLQECAETLQNQYPDSFASVYAFLTWDESALGSEEYRNDTWQSAGDPNSDGVVDATDAAELLITAAENGTGAAHAVTSAADVNADGAVDAQDAAAVLSYAAVKGTGAEVSWVDILRR